MLFLVQISAHRPKKKEKDKNLQASFEHINLTIPNGSGVTRVNYIDI